MIAKLNSYGLIAALAGMLAIAPPAHTSETNARTVMGSCDKNADQRIDREEYHSYVSESFYFVDQDKDGHLVLEEIEHHVRAMDRDRAASADKDSDGRLSIHEFWSALHKDFEDADLDDDSMLDMDELKKLMTEVE